MDRKAFGRRLNIARKERGFTSERLSECCNINATYLRQIEAGVKTPSLPVLVDICRQLKISPNYLLIDTLPDNEYSDIRELAELLSAATPAQRKIAVAMIGAALTSISEERALHDLEKVI